MPLRGLTPAEAVSGAGGRGQRAGRAANTPGGTKDTAARTRGTQVQTLTHACPQRVVLLRWFHCLVAQLSLTLQPRGL